MILFLLLSVQYQVFAQEEQQIIISGTIVDEAGNGYPGATIYMKNLPGKGTASDLNGKFTIKVDSNTVIVVKALGMKTVEKLMTKSQKDLKIELKEDASNVDEVVVTGLTSQ